MAHRYFTRDVPVSSRAKGEGMLEAERARMTRRGRSATPGLLSLWDENRRLYMDNLRLWDCLALVRSDPTMTCQNAIKLVFGLDDEDYLRMFPEPYPPEGRLHLKQLHDITALLCIKFGYNYSPNTLSRSMVSPTYSPRRGCGSATHHQDFTSNWKPTTPLEQEPTADKIQTSAESHWKSDWAILCWRQNYQFRPVDVYALEGAKRKAADEHYCSQAQKTIPKGVKIRERRRSNTVSREGGFIADRISKGPSHAAPIKCVSFAEPLPSFRTGSPIVTEFVCVRDKAGVILDANYDHNYRAQTKEEHPIYCSANATEACDLKDNTDSNTGSTKNVKSTKSPSSEKRSRIYTAAAIREPSKRCQRDTATSPVLDTRTCFLILGQTNQPILLKHDAISMTSASADCVLNTSSNNDNSTATTLPTYSKPAVSPTSGKSRRVRPLSPKRRDLHQARMKNMISSKKFNSDVKHEQKCDARGTCNTNNALQHRRVVRLSTLQRFHVSNNINAPYSQKEEDKEKKEEEVEDDKDGSDFLWHVSHFSQPNVTEVTNVNFTPKIFFSDYPAPVKKRNMPYSLQSYTTVKHFLDRHRRLMQEPSCSRFKPEVFTREITPSVALLADNKASLIKQQEDNVSSSDLETLIHTSSSQDGTYRPTEPSHQELAKKYKGKWHKSEDTRSYISEGSKLQFNYREPGKLKECETSAVYSKKEKLMELKKLGNFKYSKPLATMLKRNGCYQRRAHKDRQSSGSKLPDVKHFPESKRNVTPLGSFSTFISKM